MKRKPKPPLGFFARWFRRLAITILTAGCLVLGMIAYANFTAIWTSRGRLYDDVASLPPIKVGLVLGTTDRVNGHENPYFRYRIDAAEKVWKAGRLKILLVSGDNLNSNYNEPAKMKQALIERGIPAARIVSDPRGLRTLDSVVRAKEIYGAKHLLIISQRFQNQRAIYLAQANGIDARGFNAQDVEPHIGLKTSIREIGARVKMWLDVQFLNTRPSHLGEKVPLPP
jgi:SanA protein